MMSHAPSPSLVFWFCFFSLLTRYSLGFLEFVCLFLEYKQVLSKDDIKTSRLILVMVQSRDVSPGAAGRSGLAEADRDTTFSMHCLSYAAQHCGQDKTH